MAGVGRGSLIAVGIAAGILGGYGVLRLRHFAMPREPGLVGLWTFNEGSGEIIQDSSGSGNDGVIFPPGIADASKWGAGPFAGAISLSGTDRNHVRIPPSDTLNAIKQAVTVCAYVYPRSLWTPGSNREAFVSVVQRQWRTVGHPDLYYLGFGLENGVLTYKWHVGLNGAEPALYRLPPGVDRPRTGGWVHLAGTYDGSSGAMVLYVDGVSIGSDTVPGQIRMDDGSTDRPLIIGAELNVEDIDAVSGTFDGDIDEVRLYSRALSAD